MALIVDTIGKIDLPTGREAYGLILVADSREEAMRYRELFAERVEIRKAPTIAVVTGEGTQHLTRDEYAAMELPEAGK